MKLEFIVDSEQVQMKNKANPIQKYRELYANV